MNPADVFEELPHLDGSGRARMVDVGGKLPTHRIAVAEVYVRMKPETLELLRQGALYKGDAISVARIAGIAASKKTADLIPLAHPVPLTHVAVDIDFDDAQNSVRIEARTETTSVTGVELEALVTASTAAMTIYDMAKKYDRAMVIDGLQLLLKSGGQSGNYLRDDQSVEKQRFPRKKTTKKKSSRSSSKAKKLSTKKKSSKTSSKKKASSPTKRKTTTKKKSSSPKTSKKIKKTK